MKKLLTLSLISSALFSAFIQNSEGTFIDLYSKHNDHSDIIAQVSASKGTLVKKRCLRDRDGSAWCKVKYIYEDITLNGYVQEDVLLKVYARPHRNSTFSLSYGGRYDDVANKIISTKNGYIVVGKTASFGNGQSDAYVMALDEYGNKIYSLALGGASDDEAKAVVAFNDAYYIGGYTKSFGNGIESLYMAKISYDGKVAWNKAYYSDKDDYYQANDMIKISKDNMLLAGFEDHVKFFSSEVNIYVNAIDVNGVRNGIKRYGGTKVDKANSLIAVKDGYVIAGFTKSWGHGMKDGYVLKIDKKGKRVWHNAFGYRYNEVLKQIIATEDGGYIAVGFTDSDVKNQKDIYVVKINADGTRAWQAHYGSRENEEGRGIVATQDGYLIAGYTNDTTSYNEDAYLMKIDKKGNFLWHRKFGLEKDDAFNAIIAVKDGFVMAGYRTSLESYSKDLYVVKVDKNGYVK